MADRLYGDVVADSTSISLCILLRSATDNSRVTGVAAGAVTAYYYRQGDASPTPITVTALGSANAAYASGGWREISSANLPGWYRFDVPNAAFAAAVPASNTPDWAAIQLSVTGTFGFDAPYRLQSAALIPDQILRRDFASVTGEAARSVLNALRLLRNRWIVTPTSFTIHKEDDSTVAWTGSVSTTPGAAAITSVDPS